MNDLERTQKDLEETLSKLKSEREVISERMEYISHEIRDKIDLHNSLVSSISNIKKEYREKIQKFSVLRGLVKEYKRNQRAALENEYKKEISRIIGELNGLKFDFKLNVFGSFDTLKAINTCVFPLLNAKKEDAYNTQRVLLKKRIITEIKSRISDTCTLADLIFYINYLIRYETYFGEDVFIGFLAKKLEKEFEYHFLSDRPSNRLDKPEWFFDFILKRYEENSELVQIYSECQVAAGKPEREVVELLIKTQHLVFQKLNEISKVESSQQRNLVLNFISRYRSYVEKLKMEYGFDPEVTEISHILSSSQSSYLKSELSRIHEMRYVQWFEEYKKLCRDAMVYISKYGDIDLNFKFKDLIVQIISHARIFIENLRFINREEIRVILYLFNEFEGLKSYILDEEREMEVSSNVKTISGSSIDKITIFNAEIFKMIKKLAISDIENVMEKLSYFTYVANETKRTVIVEINRILDEYKACLYSDLIEKTILEVADMFVFDRILLKIRFSTDEYLQFRSFFKSLKRLFGDREWKCDDACKCIDAIFEERTEQGELFKNLKFLYGK